MSAEFLAKVSETARYARWLVGKYTTACVENLVDKGNTEQAQIYFDKAAALVDFIKKLEYYSLEMYHDGDYYKQKELDQVADFTDHLAGAEAIRLPNSGERSESEQDD